MSTITFDTHKFFKQLENAGMPTAQAEALLQIQQEMLECSIDSTLATHADIDAIEHKLIEHDSEFKLIKWMLGIVVGGVLMIALKLYFPV